MPWDEMDVKGLLLMSCPSAMRCCLLVFICGDQEAMKEFFQDSSR